MLIPVIPLPEKFQKERSLSKDRLKRPIPPLLEVGFEKCFDSHMQNCIGKLKMIKLNRFDTDYKKE